MREIITNDSAVQTIASDDTEHFVLERRQDVEPILDHVQRLQQVTDGKSKSGEMYHAAEFPKVLIEKYCLDHGITFEEWFQNPVHVRRMLNDPALAGFRVWKGKV